MKAGEIEPLRGLYKNAFNLLIGAQGRGKTYHANELIGRNAQHFDNVLKYAPGGSAGDFDGDVNDLVDFLQSRVEHAKRVKDDGRDAQTLMTAIETGRPQFAIDRGVTLQRMRQLTRDYPSFKEVGRMPETLLLIDDMGGDPAIKRSEAIFNDVSRRLRHLHLTIIFNAHQYKDLAPFVRANSQIVYLHGGLPRRDLQAITQERRVPRVRDVRDLETQYLAATTRDFYGSLPLDFYGKQRDLSSGDREQNARSHAEAAHDAVGKGRGVNDDNPTP